MEWIRFAVSLVGVAVTIWCCWDSTLDALVMFGLEIRGRVPRITEARWRSSIDQGYIARAEDQRFSALCILQRVIGRLVMLIVELALSIAALPEPSTAADWKLIAHMVGVTFLTLNAFADRLERRKLLEHIRPPRSNHSC